MTQKIYRTAQGRVIDMGSLQLQNETVRAVGNMNVNARGDVIDPDDKPIDSRSQVLKRKYRQEVKVQDTPVSTSSPSTKLAKAKAKEVPVAPEDFDDNFVKPIAEAAPVVVDPQVEGLAAAIARARQIRQTTTNTNTGDTGINKI